MGQNQNRTMYWMPDLKFKILVDFKGPATTVRMINESPCFCRHSLSVVFCGSVFINRYNTTVLWRLNLHYNYILPRRWKLFFGLLSWLEIGLGQMFDFDYQSHSVFTVLTTKSENMKYEFHNFFYESDYFWQKV